MLKALTLALTLLPAQIALAERQDLQDVEHFLRTNVVSKAYSTERNRRLDAANVYSEYKSVHRYTGLKRTRQGLEFSVLWTVEQKLYDLDDQGHRSGTFRIVDRGGLMRCEFGQSRSVGLIAG